MDADIQAYERSLALLHRCLSAAGFLASPDTVENYGRIWARDGMITSLAALASGDDQLIAGARLTLLTLAQHQGPHGEIPSNVSVDGTQVSFGRLVGRVDALLWYLIGLCAYLAVTQDVDFKQQSLASVERALFLAGCWEYNNGGLLYTPLAGNWADEYLQQGYVLSDQLLYMLALHSAGTLFEREAWLTKASVLRETLAINYWPQAALRDDRRVYHPHAYRPLSDELQTHWLPAFSSAGYQRYFDGLAHALALLVNLGTQQQRQRAMDYVQELALEIGNPLLPAFWPVILPGTSEWQALEVNHLYGQLKNQPYTYHNGGLWPVLTGLYAAGLVRQGQHEYAATLLRALNAANAQGHKPWAFAEYHHAQNHQPSGTSHLAWSAASAVLAHQAIWHNIALYGIEVNGSRASKAR